MFLFTDLPVDQNDSDFAAFPTYPIVLAFKGTDQDVVSFPSPAMMLGPKTPPLPGIKVGLDGERYIEQLKPLDPEGGELSLKTRLIGVHKRGSGASAEMESLLVDESGDTIYRMTQGSFLVGARDFKDSGASRQVGLRGRRLVGIYRRMFSTQILLLLLQYAIALLPCTYLLRH